MEEMIRIDNVSKQYRLGQIGGGSLQGELQSWWARKRGKEDPNSKIGAKAHGKNETFLALDGVSFTVNKGERVGIIGHNGAGKSTLLKLLSRVTAPTGGEIGLNGRVASMLEVGTGFHGELTGRENIYMNGAILGMTRAEIDRKMDDIIEFSECRQFIDTPVKRYSSGMYVKLAFSVAAHLDSEILIMDEVLAVGDMGFQKKCLDKMNDVSRRGGRTILYVSHNMNTIRQLCDRVVVLDHGKVVFDGGVEAGIEVYTGKLNESMGVDVDLSESRMAHLPTEYIAKFQRLCLHGKESAAYDYNEQIVFSVDTRVLRTIDKPCIRLEIHTDSGDPVCTALNHNVQPFYPDETNRRIFQMNCSGLVPGRYKALLVLYEVKSFGAYDDLDAVWPAFTFEVYDAENKLGIRWNQRSWGRICAGELEELKP